MDQLANGEDKTSPFVLLDLRTAPNTSEDALLSNVRHNIRRELPWLRAAEPHDGVAVLVGGGPSLSSTLEGIEVLARSGATIFALNGSEKWLREHGIATDCHFVIDSRASNLKFIEGSQAKAFCLNSQCDPVLFDYLDGRDVTVCHMADPTVEEILLGVRPGAVMLGGGVTSGLTAMSLVMVLGYREMHLFGYDSSDQEGEAHAYAQSEDGAESERMDVWVGGKSFRGQPAFIDQARLFPKWASSLMRNGAQIHVHGSGLLPTIALEMQKPMPSDAGCYDLAIAPASWDFAVWLVLAEMKKRSEGCASPLRVAFMAGPDEGFRKDNLPGASVKAKRLLLENVVKPLLPLMGAVEDPEAYNGFPSRCYVLKPVVEAAKRGNQVPKFVPDPLDLREVDEWLGDIRDPITITLREAEYYLARNSDRLAWVRFAKNRMDEGQKVIFVRDTAKANEPMRGFVTCPRASKEVGFRAALYHRAKANLFTNGGAMMLAVFGERPFLIFKELVEGTYANPQQWRDLNGLNVGEQYPWATPFQRLTWSRDTVENIEAAWQKLVADMNAVPLAAE